MAKQLSLPERYVIERMLHQDYSFASIGRNLDWSASTIAREVLHYRCFTSRIPIMGENDCINRSSCQRNTLCPEMGMVVFHPDVSVVLKELFVHLSAIIMILFSAIYSISLPMSTATVRCRRDVKRTRLITLRIRRMQLITNP